MGEPEQVAYLKNDVLFSGNYNPNDSTHCAPTIVGGRMPKNIEPDGKVSKDGPIRFYWDDTTLYAGTRNSVGPATTIGSFVTYANGSWVQPDPTYEYTTSAITKFDGAMITAGGVYQGVYQLDGLAALEPRRNLAINTVVSSSDLLYLGTFDRGVWISSEGGCIPAPVASGSTPFPYGDVDVFTVDTSIFAINTTNALLYILSNGTFTEVPRDTSLADVTNFNDYVVFNNSLYISTDSGVAFYENGTLTRLGLARSTSNLTVAGSYLYAIQFNNESDELVTITSIVKSLHSYSSLRLHVANNKLYVSPNSLAGSDNGFLYEYSGEVRVEILSNDTEPIKFPGGATCMLYSNDKVFIGADEKDASGSYLYYIYNGAYTRITLDTHINEFSAPVDTIVNTMVQGDTYIYLGTNDGVYTLDPSGNITGVAGPGVTRNVNVDSFYKSTSDAVYFMCNTTYYATGEPDIPWYIGIYKITGSISLTFTLLQGSTGMTGSIQGIVVNGNDYVSVYDKRGGVYQVMEGVTTRLGDILPANVNDLMIDGGKLYIAAGSSIYRLNESSWDEWATNSETKSPIKRILRIDDGRIVALTENNRLYEVPNGGGSITVLATPTAITAITPTRRAETVTTYLEQLSGAGLLIFERDIFCTLGNFLGGDGYVYDGANDMFTDFPGFEVSKLFIYPEGKLICDNIAGISKDYGSGTQIVFKDSNAIPLTGDIKVNDVVTYGSDFWLLTSVGMFYKTGQYEFTRDEGFQFEDSPNCVAFAIHANKLFVLTNAGELWSYDSSTPEYFGPYTYDLSPSFSITEGRLVSFDGTLYVGTNIGLYSLSGDILTRVLLPTEDVDINDASITNFIVFGTTLYTGVQYSSGSYIYANAGTGFSFSPIDLKAESNITATTIDQFLVYNTNLYALIQYDNLQGITISYVTLLTDGTFTEAYTSKGCMQAIMSYMGNLVGVSSSVAPSVRDLPIGCGEGIALYRVTDHNGNPASDYLFDPITILYPTENGIYIGRNGLWFWDGEVWTLLTRGCFVNDIVSRGNISGSSPSFFAGALVIGTLTLFTTATVNALIKGTEIPQVQTPAWLPEGGLPNGSLVRSIGPTKVVFQGRRRRYVFRRVQLVDGPTSGGVPATDKTGWGCVWSADGMPPTAF